MELNAEHEDKVESYVFAEGSFEGAPHMRKRSDYTQPKNSPRCEYVSIRWRHTNLNTEIQTYQIQNCRPGVEVVW